MSGRRGNCCKMSGVYHTQINDVLLAAMLGAWQRWTGKHGLLIDLEGHGRESVIPGIELSRTVGWFTIVYPVRLNAERNDDIGQRLKTIKEKLRQVPGQGIGYGVLRYMNKDAESASQLHQQPGAEVSFNYLGQLDAALSKHGLFTSAGRWRKTAGEQTIGGVICWKWKPRSTKAASRCSGFTAGRYTFGRP